jgi:glycosyltransferase involved in cell wall biosynthesis
VVVAHGLREAPLPARPPRRPGPLRVVATGSVIVQKGHDVLLEASARAGGAWEAEVIGTGSDRGRLETLARSRGLPVRFAGWRDDVPAALAGADVACMPSRWESAGYAALEAMRAGLPVVASDVDGLRELVEHGRCGLLVPPENPVALAGALGRLAADPDLVARLAAGARRRAAQFTSADMAAATLTVYGEAIAARARRARPATSPNTIPM